MIMVFHNKDSESLAMQIAKKMISKRLKHNFNDQVFDFNTGTIIEHTATVTINFYKVTWLFKKSQNFITGKTEYGGYHTPGMVRWLKKSSNETCVTWSHMQEKSRWFNFKMAQNLDHVSFYWDGSLFWAISVFMIVDFSCIWLHVRNVSFDHFLSHRTILP